MSVSKAEQAVIPGIQQKTGVQGGLEFKGDTQTVMPGFHGELGISELEVAISAENAAILSETPFVRPEDIMRVMTELGMTTAETAREDFLLLTREHRFDLPDVWNGVTHLQLYVCVDTDLHQKYREVYGEEPSRESLFGTALRGVTPPADLAVNLERTPEEAAADKEAIIKFLAGRDPGDDAFVGEEWLPEVNARRHEDSIKSMKKGERTYGPRGEVYIFDGTQLQLQPKNPINPQ